MTIEVRGKIIVLTGKFTHMTRKQATAALIQQGATVTSSVNSNVDLLFVGQRAGSKLKKAQQLNIPVHREDELVALLVAATPTTPATTTPADVKPLQDIADGEVVYVQGSAAKPYEMKNVGGVYSCTCPAWRNQSRPIDKRTCKHLKRLRGEAAEIARIGAENDSPSPTPTTSPDAPGVMLAQRWTPDTDPTGWWMSEKLDGVRAYWDGKALMSRLGNTLHAPAWFVDDLPAVALDGELWIERGAFQRTVSVVRRQDGGRQWAAVRYLVFDAPDHNGLVEDRFAWLRANLSGKYVEVVEQTRCTGPAHLRQTLAQIEQRGGEGLMLREPGSKYVRARSTSLLKVKSFFDSEARVLSYKPGAGKHRGRVGALLVVNSDGVDFAVGTGLSDHDRENPPAIGSVITYRYQELTNAGVPRFPSYLGVRNDFRWPTDAKAGHFDEQKQIRIERDKPRRQWRVYQSGHAVQTVTSIQAAIREIAARVNA